MKPTSKQSKKMAKIHVLYRHFNNQGDLLYVGRTFSPSQRMKQHSKRSKWWKRVTKTTYQHYDSFEELIEAERVAIQVEKPKYNKIFNHPPKEKCIKEPALPPEPRPAFCRTCGILTEDSNFCDNHRCQGVNNRGERCRIGLHVRHWHALTQVSKLDVGFWLESCVVGLYNSTAKKKLPPN